MKISCEIIKDLLPLYADHVCSKESSELIEQHIENCESCNKELEMMQKDLPIAFSNKNLDDAQKIKNLKDRWSRDMKNYLLYGALGMLSFVLLLAILSIFIGIDCVPK